MAIIQGNAKQGSTRGFYPKVINGSLRFNDDDIAYLSWTPTSAGNRKTWTWSGWVKRGNLGAFTRFFTAKETTSNSESVGLRFDSSDRLDFIFIQDGSSSITGRLITTQVFRDVSAWYHIVFVQDTTASDGDKMRLWVNGSEVTQFDTETNMTTNHDGYVNKAVEHRLGAESHATSQTFDGYLANVHFIDGQALTASDFGETKNGVWVAKNYAGTFGTNGFYLTFEDDTAVEAFNTVLYRGTGSIEQEITGFGFQPDLLWIKCRGAAENHNIMDSVRGWGKRLKTNSTDAEQTFSGGGFYQDGFAPETTSDDQNKNGFSFVAWCWKAGDSNVSNTDGTITSTVRANDTYGFSIVSYTGNNTAGATVGHGLSTAPSLIIHRNRTSAFNWLVVQGNATYTLHLNETSASPTSTGRLYGIGNSVFTLGSHEQVNRSSDTYIAYCWAEKTGYSKFGSYTGNGSTSGPTVTCGFKPAMIILKRTDSGGSWTISDNTRDTVNPVTPYLFPHASDAEATDSSNEIDFNSNGFQIKHDTRNNTSGATYIYAAFADTREAAFWLDQSGNDNDWQPVNLDHNDTVADSPTNNFATFNPLAIAKYNATGFRTLGAFSDGNLTLTTNADNESGTVTFGATSGKYYMEFTSVSLAQRQQIIVYSTDDYRSDIGAVTTSSDGSGNATDRVTWTTGDVIGIAVDMDNNKVFIHKNGDYFGTSNPSTNTGGDTLSAFTGVGVRQDSGSTGNAVISFNAGQQPFKYDPPA